MKAQVLTVIFSIGLAVLAVPGWTQEADDSALTLAREMNRGGKTHEDIVLTLMAEGRTLPEATNVTMQTTHTFNQRTSLARTVLCMSEDSDEASRVVQAALAAIPPDDPAVNEIVSEHVKYQRSSCLDDEILERPPVDYAIGGVNPDVSPSR